MAPDFAETFSLKEPTFTTAVESAFAFKIKEQKKWVHFQVTDTTWTAKYDDERRNGHLFLTQEDSVYENEMQFPCNNIRTIDFVTENEHDLPTAIELAAKPLQQQNTKLEAEAFAKMDSIFFSDPAGLLDLEGSKMNSFR